MKYWLSLVMSIASFLLFAQEELKPRVSPMNAVSIRHKDGYLKIIYSQPQKKGREVFGKLVPFGQVWRTGANEATEMTTTWDISINGTVLKAGTYSLFTIPGPEKWIIILNKDLGLWGSYNYNSKSDALRFDVPAKLAPGNVVYEPFTIRIDQKTDTAEIFLLWDKTQVSFPIQFIEPKP
ncbi:hypothetical protein WSM22_28060 [Cytophagales bacterium WSM2-2]|nr:hypothetical protein WSM22_28060 [Cytophagales bacterium WSM2-2]